jgi:hypothetical protein
MLKQVTNLSYHLLKIERWLHKISLRIIKIYHHALSSPGSILIHLQ